MKDFFTLLLKKSITLLILLIALATFAQNKTVYTDSWGEQGLTLKDQNRSALTLNSSLQSFTLTDQTINNILMQTLTTNGVFLPNNEGAPNIPVFSKYIAVPQGAKVHASIKNISSESIHNIEISPSPVIPKDNENGPLVYHKDQSIYSSNQLYPQNIVTVSEPMAIRGLDVVMIGVSPFQYNPVTKELIVNRDIEIEILFEGGNGKYGDDRLRSRWWDPIMRDAVLNNTSIQEIQYSKRNTRSTGCEYLIIVPNDPTFISWADSIKNFRNRQGILTDVVTTDDIGGNSTYAIENYIDNAYNTWDIPPAAVLLMADYGTTGNTITSPIYDNYCVSDNIFADVDNDQLPDVILARMTAQNETHLETFVTKVLDYERNPPTNPDFYNHPITALGWQTERWFQICSESVGGFFKNVQGKEPVRINEVYDGNPDTDPWSFAQNTNEVLNYFGPDGLGYIPASPTELGNWTNGSASDINNAINSGAFILQHRDHGGSTGWGEPSYHNNNINSLTNDQLIFVFSINCLTGRFNNSDECFAEKFHRYTYNGQNSGALGLIAASEVSYSFVNDAYVWGLYDNMWTDFMPDYGTNPESRDVLPAFGNAAGKYFLYQSSWPYNSGNKEVTYHLFHHHGDAFTTVYSEVPQYLTVAHEQGVVAGETTFEVTADAGSLIALSVNNELLATAEGTGSAVVLNFEPQYPPDKILVTVTKQNYFRYEVYVDVVPPAGPYVIFNNVIINNSNGLLTTGETEEVSIQVKNIGVEDGDNISVTISTSDPYIELTNNTMSFGTIASDSTVTSNGYSWKVADDIPDLHMINFDVIATNGVDTWESKMNITGHAPVLEVGNIIIDDSQSGNNNGRIDPGETVDIIIITKNTGSSNASNTISGISCNSAFTTLLNETYDIGTIESPSIGKESIFTIAVADEIPNGLFLDFEYGVESGTYTDSASYRIKAGQIIEDWETGDMTKFDWQSGGSAHWNISTNDPFEGTYCIKSDDLEDNQATWLTIISEAIVDDTISFWTKVSSEGDGNDFLRFYIDNIPTLTISGEHDWQYISYPVNAGTHLFKWMYSKNDNTSVGEDCAYLDFISLPTPTITNVFAGQNRVICENENIQCNAEVTNCETVLWETIGDGTFENAEVVNTMYYPGEQDFINGFVKLILTGFNSDLSLSDTVTYTLVGTPEVNAGVDADICPTISYTLSDAEATDYESIFWTTSGDGSFDNISKLNATYTPGENDKITKEVTLSLNAVNSGDCPDAVDDMILTLYCTDIIDISQKTEISIFPNPNEGSFILSIQNAPEDLVSISIYDVNGTVVYKEKNIEINKNFSTRYNLLINSGIYTISIYGNKVHYNSKFVVK